MMSVTQSNLNSEVIDRKSIKTKVIALIRTLKQDKLNEAGKKVRTWSMT